MGVRRAAGHYQLTKYLRLDASQFSTQDVAAKPNPFSGRLMVRLPPRLHRKVFISARREGKSLNQWIAEKLDKVG